MMTTQPHIDTHLDVAALQALQGHLATTFGSKLLLNNLETRELTIRVAVDDLLTVLHKLKTDKKTAFTMLVDVTAVDWLGHRPAAERFDVVYHLLSLTRNLRLRLKVYTGMAAGQGMAPAADMHAPAQPVPSVVGLFASAGWYEREVWDMYGIPFTGHPDLRRILTDYDFNGHPLRKDFPLEGFVETYYDAEQQRVAYKPVDLPQEFRHFDGTSPWSGMTGNSYLAETDNTFDRKDFE